MLTKRSMWLKAACAAALFAFPVPATAQWTEAQTRESTEFRQEQLARSIGTLAYVYAYPAVDYYRVMHEQTTRGLDASGAYAPINRFFSSARLSEPGGLAAGRSPNADTIYFQAWIDLRNGPLVISAPDTHDRYYNLDYVNFLSETDAHTGRRTTGTGAQQIYLVGPRWQGEAPKGMHLIRMTTDLGLIFGRVLIRSDGELKQVNALIDRFTIREAEGTKPATPAIDVSRTSLHDLDFFRVANVFLRTHAIKPGEQALMDQFDSIGIGPTSTFDAAKLSEATRRGFTQAAKDGQRIVEEGRRLAIRGWAPVKSKIGVYGTDYFSRAAVEYSGLLANMPEEAVYPRYRADLQGNPLDGANRYRIVVPKEMPVDAFWSLTAYSGETRDLIPNDAKIYSVGDRDPSRIKRRADGSAVILIQQDRPTEKNVNWLPVQPGGFYLLMRLYQPRPEAFASGYTLPEVEKLGLAG